MLSQLCWLRPDNRRDALWALEQTLASTAYGAVLVWIEGLQFSQLRRLQLACATSGVCGFLFFSPHAQPSPALLRLQLTTDQAGERAVIIHKGAKCGYPVTLALSVPCYG